MENQPQFDLLHLVEVVQGVAVGQVDRHSGGRWGFGLDGLVAARVARVGLMAQVGLLGLVAGLTFRLALGGTS